MNKIKTKLNRQYNYLKYKQGFTLIESLVAITVLTIAVAAPLTLASQALSSSYIARDQVVAFNLAQEAIETVRAQRDHNILAILKNSENITWLERLYVEKLGDPIKPFTVDSLSISNNFTLCSPPRPSGCPYLLFNNTTGFYGHESGNTSKYKRYVRIVEVPGTNGEEVRVISTVSWKSGIASVREVILEENMYNWISAL